MRESRLWRQIGHATPVTLTQLVHVNHEKRIPSRAFVIRRVLYDRAFFSEDRQCLLLLDLTLITQQG